MNAKKQVSLEDVLAESQRARFVADEITPHFTDLRNAAISRLQAAHTEGKLTVELATAVATELNTLDSLRARLIRKVARANGHPSA